MGCIALVCLATPWARELFFQQTWQGGYVFLVALAGAFAVSPLMARLGHQFGFVDLPTERKIHSQATPRLGGIAVYLGLMGALWLGSALEGNGLSTILLAGSLLLAIGLIDDAGELPAWMRLAAQVVGAGIVVWSGTILTLFPTGLLGDAANVLITLVWIVGITNAFNFFDGMDGLATGLAILMAFFLGIVAFETGQTGLGLLALAIAGACLGFLPFNFRVRGPACIFLGDSGATFLGFTLACLAVKGEWADANPIVSFSSPLLIFGVLIYDMIHITVERLATGKVRTIRDWIEYVGKDHLHHRLERALGSRVASVLMIFSLTICLGLAAMVLRKAGTTEAILLLTQAALIVIMVTTLEHAGRR
ncbi:MAG: MraY family glycosyltransferase [Nitrospirales bacterium]